MRSRLATRQSFLESLHAVLNEDPPLTTPLDQPGGDYALWAVLLSRVNDAIAATDWPRLRTLLELYDGVERAGERGEMYDASYVAFLEDVRLPNTPAALREFWRHVPPLFAAALKRDRGLQ
jgi:hypothetical protein